MTRFRMPCVGVMVLASCGPASAPSTAPAAALGSAAVRTPGSASPAMHPRGPKNSTELQALARAEEERFARAVAAEPSTPRSDVTAVSPEVFVDRERKLVYVLASHFVALDLATGKLRWPIASATGTSLARLGTSLVVVGAESPVRPRLVFVDPVKRSAHECVLAPPVPAEAEVVSVLPFDRAGQPFIVWMSRAEYRQSGVRPSDEDERRKRAAQSCGIAALDIRTCALTPARIGDFLLSPPRDAGSVVERDPEDCRNLAPEREMPAVAAAVVPPHTPIPQEPSLTVTTADLVPPTGGCARAVMVTLEARDDLGKILWTYALSDRWSTAGCPPPPSLQQK